MASDELGLTSDHAGLDDALLTRRYFSKFEKITGHLGRVAAAMETERSISRTDVKILAAYISGLSATFQALSNKYLMTGRETGQAFGSLTIDRVESGFPVFSELLNMASDAQQAERHLRGMPSIEALKNDMIRTIVGEQSIPTQLQYALSQRLYYEKIHDGRLFWARNDPEAIWQEDLGERRRRFLIHWAVYDSQTNLPVVYLMEVDDTGRTALPKDSRRWPEAQSRLMAQSTAGLKLLTIGTGFDSDFDDLHPKRLRRVFLGPMYSAAFTSQAGPIRQVLEQAHTPEGEDWAMAWTIESLTSDRVIEEKSGWFSTVEREVFALDPFSGRGPDTGATSTERSIIMPERPYQVLAELAPPGFRDVRKFVVNPQGRVLSYR